jgi:hypothetical protein
LEPKKIVSAVNLAGSEIFNSAFTITALLPAMMFYKNPKPTSQPPKRNLAVKC